MRNFCHFLFVFTLTSALSGCVSADQKGAQAVQYYANTVDQRCSPKNIDDLKKSEKYLPIEQCRQNYLDQVTNNAGFPLPPLIKARQIARLQIIKNYDDGKIDKDQLKIEVARIDVAIEGESQRQQNINNALQAAANQAAMQNMQNINMQNSQRLMNSVTPMQPMVRTPVQCFSNRMGSSIATNCY